MAGLPIGVVENPSLPSGQGIHAACVSKSSDFESRIDRKLAALVASEL